MWLFCFYLVSIANCCAHNASQHQNFTIHTALRKTVIPIERLFAPGIVNLDDANVWPLLPPGTGSTTLKTKNDRAIIKR